MANSKILGIVRHRPENVLSVLQKRIQITARQKAVGAVSSYQLALSFRNEEIFLKRKYLFTIAEEGGWT